MKREVESREEKNVHIYKHILMTWNLINDRELIIRQFFNS